MLKLNTPSAENGRGGGEQNAVFIDEAGLYFFVFRSNKPKALEFSRWVCKDVLPAIRKHGHFGKVDAKHYLAVVKQISVLTDQLCKSKNAFQRQMLETHLRNLCAMAGEPMPEIKLLSVNVDQTDLFEGGAS